MVRHIDTLRMSQAMLDQCEEGTVTGRLFAANLGLIHSCLAHAERRGVDTKQERQRLNLLDSFQMERIC